MKHTQSYIKDFPRPSFVRDHFQNLNGAWAFKFDDEKIGEELEWHLGLDHVKTIRVPYAYQTKRSGIHDTFKHDVVWYEKTFDAEQSPLTMLHFDGSDYRTKVWLNGTYLGFNEGGYHRFSFDASLSIKEKDNKLVVRVCDTFDTAQPRGKQRWKDENFGCWYVETTGIWKTVWLEYLSESYMRNADIKPDLEKMSVTIDYQINQVLKDMALEVTVSFENTLIAKVTQIITRDTQQISFSILTDADQFKIKTWSQEDPNLYDVTYELIIGGDIKDTVKSYFGVRTWKAMGKGIYLNDEPIYLKMILDQGYWPEGGLTATDELDFIRDIKLAKDMGFNGIRKHQKIEDERFYYYCDIMGIHVWLEMPSAYEFNNRMMTRITNEWTQILAQYKHYPSIMTYVLMNESWGVHHIKHNFKEQQFTLGLYGLTKAMDPSRFVISNDGWEHTKSDLITIHNYTSSGQTLKAIYGLMDDVLNDTYVKENKIRSVFANGFKYQGEPILISEYGGIALEDSKGWGYGDKVHSIDSYLTRLEDLTKAIHDLPSVCGYCLTQMTDVEQETNGVLDHTHEPKTAVENIRKINENR